MPISAARAAVEAAPVGPPVSPPALTPQVECYHLDALGSLRAVTDQSGQILRRHDYLPFGEEWQAPAVATDTPLFTGHERDAYTGLDYFGARYHRADLGRFTTVDPAQTTGENLVDPQRWNRYAYVTNNPLRYVDPDGRDRMGMYEPSQRGEAAPWRGLWEEVKSIGAVAGVFVVPLIAPELVTAWAGVAADLGGAAAAQTVWGAMRATQPVWEGTVVPRSFELGTSAGKVWVRGNATEHLAEYATSMLARGVSGELVKVATQAQLSSLQSAVTQVLAAGIKYNQIIQIAGWELKFGVPSRAGQLPALIHAMPLQ